ncbi:PLP-dependent transferase [Xylariaceae sp. AK1471]|nr:PLP-dependent transferase [Xylariaceae sp. AK1471]
MLKGYRYIQPKSPIGSTGQSKQNVIGRLASGRLHQMISTAPAVLSIISTTKMAGQLISSASKDDQNKECENKKKKSINLLRGWPATSLLPAAALRAASHTALSDQSIWAPGLEYGPDPGYQPLRKELARWLGGFYGDVAPTSRVREEEDGLRERSVQEHDEEKERDCVKAQANRITITGGASQSLACLLQSFTDPARTLAVWIVAPCYFLACPIFADAGLAGRLRAVPEDEEGIDLVVLAREICALEEKEEQQQEKIRVKRGMGQKDEDVHVRPKYKDVGPHRKTYRHVIYCVPTFSNPSGRTMTLARRQGLVNIARKHDALVVCDDVYDMLQWRVESPAATSIPQNTNLDKALLPRLTDLDIAQDRSPYDPPGKHFGHVVSNGSFSKLVAPGVRTGWTYSTADFAFGMAQTGSTRSGGAPSQLAATIVCELLKPATTQVQNTAPPATGDCQLTQHIRNNLRPTYARRHGLLMRTIRAELVPLGVHVHEGSLCGRDEIYGGYFVWMTVPSPSTMTTTKGTATTAKWPTAKAIADRCRADENLMIGNGELFTVHGDEGAVRFDNAIRLCFSWEDEEDLVDGVERLGRVIRKMLGEGPESWETQEKEVADVDEAK